MQANFGLRRVLGKRAIVASVLLVAAVVLLRASVAFASAAPGAGPELAFTVPSGAVSIPAGGELWFAFNYAGDNSQIYVDLSGNPGATTFTIWTPGNVHARSLRQSVTPVGGGAVNSYTSNPDQVWSGSFNAQGPYFVVVNQSAQASGTFELALRAAVSTAPARPIRPIRQARPPLLSRVIRPRSWRNPS